MRPIRMRRGLKGRVTAAVWPPGVRLVPFGAERAPAVHALIAAAYAHGAGTIADIDTWWSALIADPEYDPALVFLAEDGGGRLLGVAHCWSGAFVKDLAVAEDARRQGIGRALMRHAFAAFKRRGAPALDLKVRSDNPRAHRFYRSLGMRPAP